MADLTSPRQPLTVELPAEVIEELREVASWQRISVDEAVLEACLAYTEPLLWQKSYREAPGCDSP